MLDGLLVIKTTEDFSYVRWSLRHTGIVNVLTARSWIYVASENV